MTSLLARLSGLVWCGLILWVGIGLLHAPIPTLVFLVIYVAGYLFWRPIGGGP